MKSNIMTPFIEILHVSKVYSNDLLRRAEIRALSDICLDVYKGELFALIGPNGAGKSTCMKIMAGIVHPTSGQIRIMGKNHADLSVKAQIGYLPEQIPLPLQMTPKQFLFLMGSMNGMGGSILANNIYDIMKWFHMEKWINTPMKKFSKGMLQKIGVAQAILHKPPILLLDEPSDGLDPEGRKELRDFLNNYRDQGNTVFLNSHLLSELEIIADRIAIMNNGTILKVGPLREFMTHDEHIEINFKGKLPDFIENELKKYNLTISGDSIRIELIDPSHLGKLLELLSSAGIVPSSITTKRGTLEDTYLSIIKGDNRQ